MAGNNAVMQDTFDFAGHRIFYKRVELGGDHEALLDNFLDGDRQTGSARIATVVAAFSDKRGGQLSIDGKRVNFRNVKKPFPRIRDENGKSLMTVLLELIVAAETWLAEDEKYSDVFMDYLVEDGDDEYEDGGDHPTPSGTGGEDPGPG